MLDATAATELARNMDRFLRQNHHGYQLESIREHALSFTIAVFFGHRLKIDLLLSPYYANKKVLLDRLSEYKSQVERQHRPHLWNGIVHT